MRVVPHLKKFYDDKYEDEHDTFLLGWAPARMQAEWKSTFGRSSWLPTSSCCFMSFVDGFALGGRRRWDVTEGGMTYIASMVGGFVTPAKARSHVDSGFQRNDRQGALYDNFRSI